ncbi:hypothetical protein LAZ67_3003005 [Cordylochernes scorpioides]|uniref:Peptidase M13 C-terminal domain-containing protein n=1 Tax=Cordylochernes scorpioides TaxID=51811 RepID=A0ABY6K971_9ARAC|nr:hypothetical protein LAZ67_3003005 [Cordylochernes scorpioides]
MLLPLLHIKLGLKKYFVKTLKKDSDAVKYLMTKYLKISCSKITEGIFIGTQIRKLINDEEFIATLKEDEKNAWLALIDVVKHFLGNNKSPNYARIVENLIYKFHKLECITNLNFHFMDSHLNFSSDNLGAESEEQAFFKNFHLIYKTNSPDNFEKEGKEIKFLNENIYGYRAKSYLNYGGVGQVIGHEIGHSFDNEGIAYKMDQPGLSEDQIKEFKDRVNCYYEQYSKLEISAPGAADEIAERHLVEQKSTDERQQGETQYRNVILECLQIFTSNTSRFTELNSDYILQGYLQYEDEHGEEPGLPALEKYTNRQLFLIQFAQWSSNLAGLSYPVYPSVLYRLRFLPIKKMNQRTCIKFCVKNEIKGADAFRMLTVA